MLLIYRKKSTAGLATDHVDIHAGLEGSEAVSPTVDLKAQKTTEQRRRITRRDALKILAAVGAAAALNTEVIEAAAEEALDAHAKTSNPQTDGEQSAAEKKEDHEKASWIDMSTATIILTNFLHIVLYKSAYKKQSIDWKDAVRMQMLAWGRIAFMTYFGTEEDKHLAHEEKSEILESSIPIPILVALSDITTHAFKVNEKAIFAEIQGALDPKLDYMKVQRPELGENIEAWEKHLERANKDLITKTSQIAAITQVLAPIFTTYTSSSLANSMKADVLRILYEQSYAITVVAAKKKDSEVILGEDQMHESAASRAEHLFNGPRGYSKLMISLAANKQGAFLLGDPPELYFLQNHHDDPALIGISQLVGLCYGEMSTIALNAVWLRDAGALSKEFYSDFVVHHGHVLNALGKTLEHGTFGAVAALFRKDVKAKFIKALEQQGIAQAGAMREVLQKIPDSFFQLRLGEYFEKKAAILSRLSQEKDYINHLLEEADFGTNILDDTPETQKEFATSGIFQGIRNAWKNGDNEKAIRYMKHIEKAMQQQKVIKLSELLEGLMEESPENDKFFETFKELKKKHPKASEETLYQKAMQGVKKISSTKSKVEENHGMQTDEVEGGSEMQTDEIERNIGNVLSLATEISHELLDLVKRNRQERIDLAMRKLEVDPNASAKEVKAALQKADQQTIVRALADLTELPGKHDAVLGPYPEGEEHAKSLARKIEILSASLGHSAKEVLWALLTQVSSVPAIARMAEIGLPKLAGVEEGQPPTADQLKNIVSFMIPLEAGMSGVADNVAAYMFAEGVLYEFFKQRYNGLFREKYKKETGEDREIDVIKLKPGLKRKISIIAKLVAEAHGDLTQLGNGPNFSQEKCVIKRLENEEALLMGNNQGINIDFQKMEMSETVPWNNQIALGWNLLTCYGCIKILHNTIDDLEDDLKNSLQSRTETRGWLQQSWGKFTELFKKFRR